jgi:hypothetical protein
MAKITFTDKTTANTSPLPATQKLTSADANEIKASVNALYDQAGFLPTFTAVVSGVTKTYRQGTVLFNGKQYYFDVEENDPSNDVFQWVEVGGPTNGTWVLLVGGVTTSTETAAANSATPQDVPAWTGTTPVLSPLESTSQEAIEALGADVSVLNLTQYGKYRGKRTFSGATDTLVITDAGGLVSQRTTDRSRSMYRHKVMLHFPELTTVTCFANSAAGQITFAPGSGVTLLSGGGALKTAMPYGGVALTLINAATNTWWVEGNLTV